MMNAASARWTFARRLFRLFRAVLGARRSPVAPAPATPARRQADPEVQHVLAALKQVLDRHPKARKVFGHLALLEQGLCHLGADMLQRMSPGTLQRAQQQLASVATEEETRPLTALLEQAGLLQALAPAPLPASGLADDFSVSRFTPEVTEADPAAYFQLMRAWQDTLVEEEEPAKPPPAWLPTLPMPISSAA
jgi:hypothetical protein